MINFILIFNRQGKVRLQKWYDVYSFTEKKNIRKEMISTTMARDQKMSNIVEWKDMKIVYKRYASLIILFATSKEDNELITLELIHRYVEVLDMYILNVCALDIIYNFEKVHFLLDEFIMAGEVQDTSIKAIVEAVNYTDNYQKEELKTFDFEFLGNI